jgi:hypothetical protein
MANVFISHSSLDQGFAENFAAELRKYRHEPTGDVQGLRVSQDWDTSLLDALAEADVVVFLFTNHATGSENILAEVGSAKILSNLVKKPQLIPVVFPGGALPEPLSRVWAQILPAVPSPAELGAKVNSLIADLPMNPGTTLGTAFVGDKITPQWLWKYVPVSYWFTLVGLLVSLVIGTFAFGVKAGQIPWVAGMLGEKAPPVTMTKKP